MAQQPSIKRDKTGLGLFFSFSYHPRAHRHSRAAPQTRQAFAECVILDCTIPLSNSPSRSFFTQLSSRDLRQPTLRCCHLMMRRSEHYGSMPTRNTVVYISVSLHSTIFHFSFLFPSFFFSILSGGRYNNQLRLHTQFPSIPPTHTHIRNHPSPVWSGFFGFCATNIIIRRQNAQEGMKMTKP